jgi:gliding motility-associated-like protein
MFWNISKKVHLLFLALLLFSFAYGQNAPDFVSDPVTTGVYNEAYSYFIKTIDIENDDRAISLSGGTLPNGMILTDFGDGTAEIAGTPTETGTFTLKLLVQETSSAFLLSNQQKFELVISKAPATVILNDLIVPYNGFSQPVTVTTIPAGLNVNIIYDGSPIPPTNAGNYTISAVIDDPNYGGFSNDVRSIKKKNLVVTAEDKSKIYGEINPALTISYSGFVGADTPASITPPSINTIATTFSNSGTYPITLSGGSAINYFFTMLPGTLTINKAPLMATADDKSRLYGQANPIFTITYTGFVNGDNITSITNEPVASTTATSASGVGSYAITLVGGTSVNYTFTLQGGTLAVNKATLTATADNKTRTYGQANPIFTITYTGFVNGDNATAITEPTASTTATTISAVGTYPITVAGGTSANYVIIPQNGTLAITKATLTAKADDKSRMYGQINPTFTITYTGFLNGDNAASITEPLASTTAITASSVGAYSIALSGGTSTNYSLTLQTGTLTIVQATLTAKADDKSRAYGQTNPTFTISYTGFVNGDNVASITQPVASTAATIGSGAGTYAITLAGGTSVNYTFALQAGTLTVNKVTLTAKADDKSRIYGQANPIFTITYTGFVNGDNAASITEPIASTTATTISAVGTYDITLAGGASANYVFVRQKGNLTISKAMLTAKADDKSRLYGQINPVFTLTYTGFLNGDNASSIIEPIATTAATTGSNVGAYSIVPSGGSSANYSFVFQNGILTISKATPIITWTNPSAITFGTPLSAAQLNATANVPGTFSYIPGVGTFLSAGSNQTLIANFTPTDITNYNSVANTQVLITVNKATPIITWPPPQPIKVGVALSSTQLSATAATSGGVPISGTFNYTPTFGTVLGAGANQTLSVNFIPTDASNYNSVLNTQVFITVNLKDNPVVTWATPSAITYGNPLTVAQLNATANVPGTFAYSPPIGTILASGTNQILSTVFTPTDAITYNTVNFTTQLTVNKAALAATPADATRLYGQPNPNFTVINYSGFVNGDNVSSITPPTFSGTTATIFSNVGVYSINLIGGTASDYTFNLQSGNLIITKATVTATADNKSKAYGEVNPPLTITYSGLLNGENSSVINVLPTASTTATSVTSIGGYLITVSGGSDDNYNLNLVPGLLTINKAILTARAEDQNRFYGQPNPTLTINYTGFVNGDNSSIILTPPLLSTTATPASDAGSYPISISGGSASNYNFNLVDGVLQIDKAVLTATADNATRLFGDVNPAFIINYSGFVNGETISVIDVIPVANSIANTSSMVGNYPITLSGGSDNNYNFSYVSGILKVTSNTPPTARNFSVVVNEDSPLTFTLTDFNDNFISLPGDVIESVSVSRPLKGKLFLSGTEVVADNIIVSVVNGALNDLKYIPNTDYNGSDSFSWSAFNGTFTSNSASTAITVKPVNDPPVLSGLESDALNYSPGDPAIKIAKNILLNDVDNGFMHSASIILSVNKNSGDILSIDDTELSSKITAGFDKTSGKFSLKGKDTKANYEIALRNILFTSSVSANTQLLTKEINITVNDSTVDSNIATRKVRITEILPELDIIHAFTPEDNTGENRFWDFGKGGAEIPPVYTKISISVYDRNGAKVFDCFTNNCKWNGTSAGGKELPAGTYMYTIDLNNGKRRYQGAVTILR